MAKARLFDWDVFTGHDPAGWTACGVTATEKLALERVSTAFAAMPNGTCAWAEITQVRLDPAHLAPRERLAQGRRVAVRLWDGGVVWSLPRRRLHALNHPVQRRRAITPGFLAGYGDSASTPYPPEARPAEPPGLSGPPDDGPRTPG